MASPYPRYRHYLLAADLSFAGSLCGLKEITPAEYPQERCFTSSHFIDEENMLREVDWLSSHK